MIVTSWNLTYKWAQQLQSLRVILCTTMNNIDMHWIGRCIVLPSSIYSCCKIKIYWIVCILIQNIMLCINTLIGSVLSHIKGHLMVLHVMLVHIFQYLKLFIWTIHNLHIWSYDTQWASDCCLMPTEPFFSYQYIMERTSYIEEMIMMSVLY